MKNTKVQKMIVIAMFAAIGVVLQFLAFPLFPAFSFLKIDFSDTPVLMSMFIFGPGAGVITALIRSSLHLLLSGLEPTNIVGDVASFLATNIFTLPMYYFFNRGASKMKNKALGLVTGIGAMTIFMSVANYFVITPLYLQFYGVTADQMLGVTMAKYIAVGIVPFNLIKGAIVSAVFMALYMKLLPWLSKKQRERRRHIA
ncbi:ECF transporter S component [Enterococcus sp.]|uniref:ECF transporter S component n=1 Tax=Enterococcus sp. TaxID=35783 RepID=UPI003C73F346